MASTRLKRFLSHMSPPSTGESSNERKAVPLGESEAKLLPRYDELPPFKNMPGCAWAVWGSEDQLGTVNLLTDNVVKKAAQEEIRIGKTVCLNWPLNFPTKPLFGRKSPEILMKVRDPSRITRDDEIHFNTQSGTQWDGPRHFGIVEHGVLYNNTPVASLPVGVNPLPDPHKIDPNISRIGIQNWAQHGICGRGVLLDLVQYHSSKDGQLPYDPWATHAITVSDLLACAKSQGVTFRQADILLIRVGFTRKYYESTQEARDGLADKPETFAGIEQSEEMKKFLWDNHFAAVASDQPALERWPTPDGVPHLHQTLLGLWGMPIGELFDLEELSKTCIQTGRYTFFFSSWPLNIIGGCASPPNAAVSDNASIPIVQVRLKLFTRLTSDQHGDILLWRIVVNTVVSSDIYMQHMYENRRLCQCELGSALSRNRARDLFGARVPSQDCSNIPSHLVISAGLALWPAPSLRPMMSRRESRVSTGARQNDALFEYEALKKKFLHANKAITKLNSTLSVRIEELNAEISTLYVENLRLRASGIALAAQLKREREKSRKLIVDTEAAAMTLTKHLDYLRQSYSLDTSPPTPPTPPSPKPRRPPPSTNTDAQIGRLSRPPNFPEIHEEDEPGTSFSSESDPVDRSNPSHVPHTSKSRSSTSRVSRHTRSTSPPPPIHLNLSTAVQRKKPSRRQSGLLNINNESIPVPRPSSPAFGSPIRRAAALAQAGDEINDELNILGEPTADCGVKIKQGKRESKSKLKELSESGRSVASDVRLSREKKRRREDDEMREDAGKLKNNGSRAALQPIDNTDNEAAKAFLMPFAGGSTPDQVSGMSPSVRPLEAESSLATANGRERRARKSVNYAEPKLNTKMRKPDPPPGSEPTSRKKRSSAAAVMTTTTYKPCDADSNNDDEAESCPLSECPPLVASEKHTNMLPLTRISAPESGASSPTAVSSLKKRKSRPKLPLDTDGESDGADADEEYFPSGKSHWVNLEGRKRNNMSKRASSALGVIIDAGIDTRRHSMAV
ncbi:hypothetical protein AX17_001890 [Amanita inopinata Kibby_2008]|nr:hypothetical protein AX17_001890 [Amanita inopinata Kibby_2008]